MMKNTKQNDTDSGRFGYVNIKILPKLHVQGGQKGGRQRRQRDGERVAIVINSNF